jgi:hypothetical protein
MGKSDGFGFQFSQKMRIIVCFCHTNVYTNTIFNILSLINGGVRIGGRKCDWQRREKFFFVLHHILWKDTDKWKDNIFQVPLWNGKLNFIEGVFNRRFFYNEPFWDMSKNGGLQIFIKMDLKCNTYGPEHKTEKFRSIEVIVNFYELVEIG